MMLFCVGFSQPHGTICTLVSRFTAQYATSRPHHITSTALASLRQNDDEPLWAFMERFTNTSVKIRNLNPEVALHAMLMALKPRPFVDNLCREAPRDMDDLRARGAGVQILEEASNNNLLTLPPPGHTPNSTEKSKHCRYHRNHGHTTEECRSLRDRARTDQPSVSQQKVDGAVQAQVGQETGSSPLRGVINTIAGRFAGGGATSSTRKRHLCNINSVHSATSTSHQSSPSISFSNEDYAGVSPNQDDPMVIAVEVANWEVQKTLIDQGSSADVLYWPTFLSAMRRRHIPTYYGRELMNKLQRLQQRDMSVEQYRQ
ncbi:uncharacterized protein LOC109792510 [Cajanus cajan]|uniref:uncharacterized protein LOC109792510 n=1 Tax=Cajanus cajan TaxID=3821 RepID=UPI00098D908F|nr:uncharacterized protein LOC109792510 [Cajanus cajan]